jgi:hypothetical protein
VANKLYEEASCALLGRSMQPFRLQYTVVEFFDSSIECATSWVNLDLVIEHVSIRFEHERVPRAVVSLNEDSSVLVHYTVGNVPDQQAIDVAITRWLLRDAAWD